MASTLAEQEDHIMVADLAGKLVSRDDDTFCILKVHIDNNIPI